MATNSNIGETTELNNLGSAVAEILQALWAYLPQILSAGLLLLIGWVLAVVLRGLSRHAVSLVQRGLEKFPGARATVIQAGRSLPPRLVPGLVFWIVMLAFIAAATQVLGLSVFSDWLSALLTQVPNLLAAALVVFFGFLSSQLSRDVVVSAAASAGIQYPRLIGVSVQLTILALALVIGLELLGLDTTFLTAFASIILGAIGAGIALSFGLGAQLQVSNLLSARDVRERYRPGERIRIADLEGTILDIAPRAVLLDTADGRVLVPARLFAEQPSTLIATDDEDV